MYLFYNGVQVCSFCGVPKSLDCFFKDKQSKTKLKSRCKICEKINEGEGRKDYLIRYHKTEKAKKAREVYRNTEENKKIMRLYHKKNKDMVKGRSLKVSYWPKLHWRVALQNFENLVKKQKGVCAICFKSEISTYRGKLCELSVDHCHKTGKIRGLLCRNCNLALGYLKDSPTNCSNAYKYLLKNLQESIGKKI